MIVVLVIVSAMAIVSVIVASCMAMRPFALSFVFPVIVALALVAVVILAMPISVIISMMVAIVIVAPAFRNDDDKIGSIWKLYAGDRQYLDVHGN